MKVEPLLESRETAGLLVGELCLQASTGSVVGRGLFLKAEGEESE